MGNWKILDTGGTAIDIETSYNVKVQQAHGVGMPPIRNVITPYGLVDGGKFQRSIAPPREFTLECIAPNIASPTLATHHTAKKNLVELVKRDRQVTEGPVTVRYTGATSDVQIDAYYVSGLEGGPVTGNVEKFSMQMIAPDPFWTETSLNNTALTPGTAINANHAIKTTGAGAWAAFGDGGGTSTDSVNAIAEDADNIYIGGVFTTWDGTTANNIIRYDKAGETFHVLGSGGTVGVNSTVTSLSIDSGGTVYVGGAFSAAGTVTTADFTKYHETPNTFYDLSFAGGVVHDLAIDSSNEVWIAGQSVELSHYDGSTINTIADNGNSAFAISIASDIITLGGNWWDDVGHPGGVASEYIAQYNIATSTWVSMANLSQPCSALAPGGDGVTVYAGTKLRSGAGAATKSIEKWNGTEFELLGTLPTSGGTVSGCYALAYDPDKNRLYAGGDFLSIDGDTGLNIVAYYDLSAGAWKDLQVDLQSQISELKAINYYSADTSAIFGYENTAGVPSVTIPQTAAVSNTGTATANPSITMLGPGVVTKIENTTTGAKLEFTGLTLASGETMTIDLSPGVKTISSTLRSSLTNLLTVDSNLSTFNLLPGSNTIALQTDNTVSGTINWYDTHWSIYGAQ